MRLALHDDRTRADAVAKEPHASHQRAVGDAGRDERDGVAGGQLGRRIDALEVGDAHRAAALFVLRLGDDQPGVDLAAEAAHRGGRQHAFGRAARAHHRVHARSFHGGGNARRQIAVADQPDARARRADVRDQLFVARSRSSTITTRSSTLRSSDFRDRTSGSA